MGQKEDFVTLLSTYLDKSALTRDDNSTVSLFKVLVGNPPHIQARDMLLSQAKDLLFTVDDWKAVNRRILQYVPHIEDGSYYIKTWVIPKTGIDGIKLKQKADNEVKHVFKDHPDDQHILHWENNNRLLNGNWIYSTAFTVTKKVFS